MIVSETFKHPRDCSCLDGTHLGIAITNIGEGRHVGLLYRLDNSIRLLHLGWHRDLKDEQVDAAFDYLWAPIDLIKEEQIALAGMAAEVSVNTKPTDFRYGIDWLHVENEGVFDKDNKIIIYPVGKGVTCATFLYGLLKSWGYMVVDSKTWQVMPGDEEWQKLIFFYLNQSTSDDAREQAKALKDDIGALRLRPEQLAGACATNSEDWPVPFENACSLAKEVIAQLAKEKARRASPS